MTQFALLRVLNDEGSAKATVTHFGFHFVYRLEAIGQVAFAKLKRRFQTMIKDKTKKEVFIIYGYKELDDGWRRNELSHPRWYIGLKSHDQRKIREYPHRNPKGDSA